MDSKGRKDTFARILVVDVGIAFCIVRKVANFAPLFCTFSSGTSSRRWGRTRMRS